MLFPGISTDHVILAVKSVRKKIGVLVADIILSEVFRCGVTTSSPDLAFSELFLRCSSMILAVSRNFWRFSISIIW